MCHDNFRKLSIGVPNGILWFPIIYCTSQMSLMLQFLTNITFVDSRFSWYIMIQSNIISNISCKQQRDVILVNLQTPKDTYLSSLCYKAHFSRQLNCGSLRCSWSIACRHCSNYIFFLQLTLGLNILRKGNCKPKRETFKFWDLVRLILEILQY